LRPPGDRVRGEAVLGDGEARPGGVVFELPLDARVAPAEDDALAVVDLLDDALALVDAQRRVDLGLELDLVAKPLLELGRLGDQLQGAFAGDGEDDFTVHDGHSAAPATCGLQEVY